MFCWILNGWRSPWVPVLKLWWLDKPNFLFSPLRCLFTVLATCMSLQTWIKATTSTFEFYMYTSQQQRNLTSLSDVSMISSFGIYFVSIGTLLTISERALILKVMVPQTASSCSCHGDNHWLERVCVLIDTFRLWWMDGLQRSEEWNESWLTVVPKILILL